MFPSGFVIRLHDPYDTESRDILNILSSRIVALRLPSVVVHLDFERIVVKIELKLLCQT